MKNIILEEGTKIYYHGDMANKPGFGIVTNAYSNKWGDFVDIKMNNGRDFKAIYKASFSEKYLGHGGTNFVTAQAYYDWKNILLENFNQSRRLIIK